MHLVYGCLAAPSEKGHATTNESTELATFSWEVSTTPIPIPDAKPSATIVIDSTKVDAAKLKELEDLLYGTDAEGGTAGTDAMLPLPEDVIDIFD